MTITEDLCKILGVDMNVPFILTCNKKVIYKVTEIDVLYFRCNSNVWQQMLYRDVLHIIANKETIQPLYWKPPMGGTYYFPKLDSKELYGKSRWQGTEEEQLLYARGMITDASSIAVDLANQMIKSVNNTRLHDYRMEM